jgi:zinc protease
MIIAFTGPADAGEKTEFPDAPPVAAVQRHVDIPKPFRVTLNNGMEVIVITSTEIPWVSATWHLDAGAAFEPADKSGLAEMTAALLKEGAGDLDSAAMAEQLDFNAISLSAGADHHTSTVQIGCLADKIDIGVRLMARAIRSPTFPKKDLARVRRQTAQGKTVSEQNGAFQAENTLNRWLFGDHFRARDASGTSRSIKRLEREEVVKYHRDHYMPNRSTLIFSGDITSASAIKLARQHFADWKRGAPLPLDSTEPQPEGDIRIVIVDRADAKQVQIRMGHRGFARTNPAYAISRLFNEVFGTSFVSRLNRRIRVEEGFTYGARGSFTAYRDSGVLRISTFTRPEKTGETVRALLDEVGRIQSIPPTAEELQDGKSSLVGSFGLSMETPQDVARRIWSLKFNNLPVDYYPKFFDRVDGFTSKQVQAFAQQHVKPNKLKIVIVGRADEVRQQLEDIAPVTVIKPGQPIPPVDTADSDI